MHTTTHHHARWSILIALAAVILAVIVYVLTADVMWTIVPLLVTVAAIRRVLRHGRDQPLTPLEDPGERPINGRELGG
jgi:hypothetical protein